MFWISEKYLSILLICQFGNLIIESKSIDLTTQPEASEIEMIEGEPLKIKCKGNRQRRLTYPRIGDSPLGNRVFSNVTINKTEEKIPSRRDNSEMLFTYAIEIKKILYGDSGLYGCGERNHSNNIDMQRTGVYIFVNSNASHFVEKTVFPIHQFAVNKKYAKIRFKEKSIRISCQPTFSSYDVELYKDGVPIPLDVNPKKDYVFVQDPGIYKCELKKNGSIVDMKEYNVEEIYDDPAPIMSTGKFVHAVKNGTLRINCTAIYDRNWGYEVLFKWTTPVRNNKGMTHREDLFSHPIYFNYRIKISELTISKLTGNNAGIFSCEVKFRKESFKSKSTELVVHDPDFNGINLTSHQSHDKYNFVGEKVQLSVAIDAYPQQPNITWFDNDGNVIYANHGKISIENSDLQTNLTIGNLTLKDSGSYKVLAQTPDGVHTKQKIFRLQVTENDFIKTIDNVKEYYMLNEIVKVDCIVIQPRLNITWSFREDPARSLHPSNRTENIELSSEKNSVTWRMQSSGFITCNACIDGNECKKVERPIHMTDVPDGFGIIAPKRKITTNETAELICAASIYNFREQIDWLDDNGSVLESSGRFNIRRMRTDLSFQVNLAIESISNTENRTFICVSTSIRGEKYKKNYTLHVHDPIRPYFIENSMNETLMKYINDTSKIEPLIMRCLVDGRPRPSISWWIDNVKIGLNNLTENRECSMSLQNKYQELHLNNPDEKCSGLYQCKAENHVDAIYTYQNITIIRMKQSEPTRKKSSDGLIMIFVIIFVTVACLSLAIYFWIGRQGVKDKLEDMNVGDFEDKALDFLSSGLTVAEQAELLHYENKWEFPEDKLDIQELLGFGSFGRVERAQAHDLFGKNTIRYVAVKKPKVLGDTDYLRPLVRELKIMDYLGKHLNVVNLLGACTKEIKNNKLMVIIEYCAFGNLRDYLRNNGSGFISQQDRTAGEVKESIESSDITSNNNNPESLCESIVLEGSSPGSYESYGVTSNDMAKVMQEIRDIYGSDISPSFQNGPAGQRKYADYNFLPLTRETLLSWAFQVASGMEYLRQRKVLHGDLAARNILLASKNIVKISDFGFAKTLHEDDNYKKKSDGPLPLKWMAIECMRDGIFSTQSDIWSFGVVLWEFFEFGKTPYPGIESTDIFDRLKTGYRMGKPEHACRSLYDLMLQCWHEKPNNRPLFDVLANRIGALMDQEERVNLERLNIPYQDENEKLWNDGKKDYVGLMSEPNHIDVAPRNPQKNVYVERY